MENPLPIKYFQHFRHLRKGQRFWVLTLITLMLGFFFIRFQQNHINPIIKRILEIEERELIYNFIYYEWLLYIALGCLVIFIISALSQVPGQKNGRIKFLEGRPIISFFLVTFLSGFFLIFLPFIFFKLGNPVVKDSAPIFDHRLYLESSIALCLILGISFADSVFEYKKTRWWYFLFIINGAFPILWWNAMAGWFPSKYWKLFKPILLAACCVIPILAFMSQPQQIGTTFQYSKKIIKSGDVKMVDKFTAYQIHAGPGPKEMYINIDNTLSHFNFANGRWNADGKFISGFWWDEASFDWELNEAFIYDGKSGKLYTIDLGTMKSKNVYSIPEDVLPERSAGIHQAYFAQSKILLIAENFGRIVSVDVDRMEVVASTLLFKKTQQIWRVKADESRGELFVLHNNMLSVLRLKDLIILRTLKFEGRALDMDIDPLAGRLIISFPRLMEVIEFDTKSLKLIRRISAPAAVRAIEIDLKNDLFIFASYGGAVEVRARDDGRLLGRKRLLPFIRRLKTFPELDRMVVTSGKYPTLSWRYHPLNSPFDFKDFLLLMAERIFKFAFINNSGDLGEWETFDIQNQEEKRG